MDSHHQTTWVRRNSNPKLESISVLDIPSTVQPSAASKHQSSAGFATSLIILSWYASNIGVLLLNKYLLSYFGFRYPVFLTMLHMCSCSISSFIAVGWLNIVPIQYIGSRSQLLKIVALSSIFSLSVVSGNMSLRYLPVSFNQAIGATTPFFTAIFAFLITCKKETGTVYMALVPVVLGIALASNGEPLFNVVGFVACLVSTAARALKSVVQGLLLTSEAEKLHSMNLLMYMAPIAVVLLLPAALIIEGNVFGVIASEAEKKPWFLLVLAANMMIAYSVNLFNFLVTKHTSALTLQVLGNAKAAVAAAISVLIFRNPVTVTGLTGFTITILGVILYSEAKKRSKAIF
ncbi:probable sugar phosphate/phosphate translocator At3g11320 isoform X1 [Selaginella moellendorffii]|nr:probable sugar phosphate/phosphate translocator At3g11320 isoform X1 [Selaginella moellendorffii]|eukprot:XP_002988030.2 probable sugar phosphate/phosphate translocator At3g11320 isoform X1 [Selaginella moellendorffii]